MSANEPHPEADWCDASVPGRPTDGNPADESLRRQIVEFLRAASDDKLKATELEAHAARIVHAWVTQQDMGNATE